MQKNIADENITEFECLAKGISKVKHIKKKKTEKNEQSICDLWEKLMQWNVYESQKGEW